MIPRQHGGIHYQLLETIAHIHKVARRKARGNAKKFRLGLLKKKELGFPAEYKAKRISIMTIQFRVDKEADLYRARTLALKS